ncbi:MAG: hypothetical protein Q8S33_35390 [Myxococcales bacterium]|nr:hypothetical protein [Myxococcales bacterium]MDP3505681.1 hypothetical protein [Myxococcales bacterium]
MSWDVLMFGSITVPECNREEWLTTPINRDEFPWLDELGGVDTSLETPEALLSFLSEAVLAPHHFFDVSADSSLMTVQGYVGEEPYRDLCQALVLLFGSAAGFGGTGELTLFGYQGIRFGERITLANGHATFRQLTQDTLGEIERSKTFQCLDARVHQRFDSLVGRPPAPHDARGATWMVHPFTGRRVRTIRPAVD